MMGDVENGGDSYEKLVHTVTITSFEMSIYKEMNDQYVEYLNEALASGDLDIQSDDVIGKTGD